ncbi:TPA: CTP synthase, partial [Candidatus Poribacteria bacterium]|nr:CTP synthase [Candidatus Poribacteria bacterium]
YENVIYLYALKGIEREIGEDHVIYVLVTYLPVPGHVGEMKTKPTQQAIRQLSENGIFPDFILCRAARPLDDIRKKKIETYANIEADHIISAPDVSTAYSIPLNFEKDELGRKILDQFGLEARRKPDWRNWERLMNRIIHPDRIVKVAMVGKYVDIGDFRLVDSYISVNQSLEHAGAAVGAKVDISWIDAKEFEQDPLRVQVLSEYDGILVPGAFGGTGAEGMIAAIRYAREHRIPFLGLCYGLQVAVVEFARHVCGMEDANSAEIDPECSDKVIEFQPVQRKLVEEHAYGGTMRLGAYAAILKEGSQVLTLYQQTGRLEEDAVRIEEWKRSTERAVQLGILPENGHVVLERHRHRYEVSPK